MVKILGKVRGRGIRKTKGLEKPRPRNQLPAYLHELRGFNYDSLPLSSEPDKRAEGFTEDDMRYENAAETRAPSAKLSDISIGIVDSAAEKDCYHDKNNNILIAKSF